jgi:uncharacterized SAM-binding protein YcdF (DUF218 family)
MSESLPWNNEIEAASLVIWDYHCLKRPVEPAEMILILGSHDLRVGDRAAELYHAGMAPLLLFTGGYGNWTDGVFEKPEAELISERAMECGVPAEAILKEPNATNTGENIRNSKALLKEKGIQIEKAIAIQKPYMERRAYASLCKQWTEIEWQITSPQLSFHQYCNADITRELVTEIMVGDLERIIEYPKLGYQTEQEMPESVLEAWRFLIKEGYDGHLMAK